MHPSRLPPPSPHPTRTSPIRHGKRFGSLTVTEEQREAAIRGDAAGQEKWNATSVILTSLLGVSINVMVLTYYVMIWRLKWNWIENFSF